MQFKSSNLVAAVSAALSSSGLSPNRLELEITETVMLQDTAATLATLHEFHALGVSIAMDDFGTGYSSLGYLRRFPFDRIKIDQSFVRELGGQRDCDAIVRAVTALGRALGMESTAEGVETDGAAAHLGGGGMLRRPRVFIQQTGSRGGDRGVARFDAVRGGDAVPRRW